MFFKINLDYVQFNELNYTISESIIPTLCLKNFEAEFLDFLVDMELTELIKITHFETFSNQFKQTKRSAVPYLERK